MDSGTEYFFWVYVKLVVCALFILCVLMLSSKKKKKPNPTGPQPKDIVSPKVDFTGFSVEKKYEVIEVKTMQILLENDYGFKLWRYEEDFKIIEKYENQLKK